MLNKKVLVAAVIGGLFAGNAAAANLSAPGGAVPAYFAKEIIATAAAPATLGTSSAGATLDWKIGYNFSNNEVRYARVECSDNIKFDSASTVVLSDPTHGSIGAINGLGTNVLTFSLTSVGSTLVGTDTLSLSGDHDITSTDQDVSCSVALYDLPSQAQNGGTTGLIQNTSFSGAYLSFAPSYELVVTPTTHVADVESTPTFSKFVVETNVTPTATQANIGYNTLAFRLRDPDGPGGVAATRDITGNVMTSLTTLFGAGTNLLVNGDYSLVASAGNTPYDATALARVKLSNGGVLGAGADALTATRATFENVQAGIATGFVQYNKTSATAAIPVADFTASIKAVGANPTVYKVTDVAAKKIGSFVRNGTELQAPLAQIPGGWYSRLVLTNTSGLARQYTISVLTEEGVTVTTGELTGTIPANGTKVIDNLNTVFSGSNRATLVVNVAGPDKSIQGLYQLVNPTSGSATNHVLVRPGTN